jgi:hypothetical protein
MSPERRGLTSQGMRFPLAFGSPEVSQFVAVQLPHRHGLQADYISWVLNYDEFLV